MRHEAQGLPRRQYGVVTIEYALLLMLGILPLLLFTINGTLVFAAKQSLSLAAAEGSRAALRHGSTEQKKLYACNAARNAMSWLLSFSGEQVNCNAPVSAPIRVSNAQPCTGGVGGYCMRVTVTFDVDAHPFLPGANQLFGWVFGKKLTSEAVVQLDPSFLPTSP